MCAVALAQQKEANDAAVAGLVRGAAGVPVVLQLQPVDDNPTRYYDGYEVTSEKDGSFYFADVKPGTYRLTAEADGLMSAHCAAIKLQAHQKREGVLLTMLPRRPLCGHLTENGSPKKTWVNAFRYDPEFDAFSKTFLQNVGEDGGYCFSNLASGTYYVQGYMTWYPGSYNFGEAKPVFVAPDGTQGPVDIPLQNPVVAQFEIKATSSSSVQA